MDLTQIPQWAWITVCVIGGFLLKELYDFAKNRLGSDLAKLQETISENSDAMKLLQMSMIELKLRIDNLTEKLIPMHEMQKDVNEAHAKIREISIQIKRDLNGNRDT